MNKQEVVELVASCAGVTRRQARESIDCYHEVIQRTLARGEKVALVGFGTFQVQKRKAHEGVNPQTGSRISTPAKDVPEFKAGRSLREAVE